MKQDITKSLILNIRLQVSDRRMADQVLDEAESGNAPRSKFRCRHPTDVSDSIRTSSRSSLHLLNRKDLINHDFTCTLAVQECIR